MKKKINLIVKEDDKNLRVDVFINKRKNSLSRTRLQSLIREGQVKLNDITIKNSSKKIHHSIS